MLDYAANGWAYWQAGRIAESFAASTEAAGRNADEVLAAFLGDTPASEFWQQVDANFSAGRIKMVFVADTIPRELAQIVEFLNEQMRADVRAVELSWFESASGVTALTPRVIGETQRAHGEKAARNSLAPVTRDAWKGAGSVIGGAVVGGLLLGGVGAIGGGLAGGGGEPLGRLCCHDH